MVNGGEEARDGSALYQTIQEHMDRYLFDRSAESRSASEGCDIEGKGKTLLTRGVRFLMLVFGKHKSGKNKQANDNGGERAI